MRDKQELLQLVEHAIAKLESKGPLSAVDTVIYRDLIALREKIKDKYSIISGADLWKVIAHLLDQLDDFFDY